MIKIKQLQRILPDLFRHPSSNGIAAQGREGKF